MLELKGIVKEYKTSAYSLKALKGIDIRFRKKDFVSILGPSGCGKTTLLNIIGGLDNYTSGDLLINRRSTKEYKSTDWDNYRNHTIGFVFQSYNLIMHLNVFENIELSLKLSGISKEEREQKVFSVLEKVGLSDKAKSLPNELSGGQMQRVAIARAIVNDPEIVLADEPTGALDSETSVQVLDLLKEISQDKLVIMVTHNPELAERYSTRIIHLMDGMITDDSNPCLDLDESEEIISSKKSSMSFLTALKLSFKNMLTKKARTILVALAGSIGIIGIALILAMSHGFQKYIDDIQESALSEYPLSIYSETVDYSFMNDIIKDLNKSTDEKIEEIEINNILSQFGGAMDQNVSVNNMVAFKEFIESNEELKDITLDIKYTYNSRFYVYPDVTNEEIDYWDPVYPLPTISTYNLRSLINWTEFIDSENLLNNKYDLVSGEWPKEANEIVVILNANGQLSDLSLYMLGERSLTNLTNELSGNEDASLQNTYQLDYFLGKKLKMLVASDFYKLIEDEGDGITAKAIASYNKADDKLLQLLLKEGVTTDLVISGVVKTKSTSTTSFSAFLGGIGFNSSLYDLVIDENSKSEVIEAQLKSENINILNGKSFDDDENVKNNYTYKSILRALGYADKSNPDSILIYASSFDNKDRVLEIIDDYNSKQTEENKIKYTDELGILMNSVSEIVNAVSYVLIAFVSVSLIVSSIMIGVITYISVLERTKEIGVLRSIGASKRDVSRVFNAETLIIGFVSGVMGIGISLLLLIPINLIIKNLTKIAHMGRLPLAGAIILIVISTLLTLIAGIIPSRIAAKKDPVKALRTE